VRLAIKLVAAFVGLVVVYLVVTFVQVWAASRHDEARRAQAIVVFGAAQYNGRPSAVLRARLDHAADLWARHLAPSIVVTGGRRTNDRFTEATASALYLERTRHVPDANVIRIVSGKNSWESLAAAARELRRRRITDVLLVSDPFHSARIKAMAGELRLQAHVSPTHTSPIKGFAAFRKMAREAAAVSVGRIVGYRRLVRVEGALPVGASG